MVVLRVVAYYESGLGGVVKAMLGQEKGRDGSLGGTGQPGQERILVACDRLTDGQACLLPLHQTYLHGNCTNIYILFIQNIPIKVSESVSQSAYKATYNGGNYSLLFHPDSNLHSRLKTQSKPDMT